MLRLDEVSSVSALDIAKVARRTLSINQEATPREIVGGLGLVFILLCERYNVSPRGVLEVTDRVIRRFHEVDPGNLRGLRRYLQEELPNVRP